jgi:16S rRNA (uracil1498-N3)-methyltransferase
MTRRRWIADETSGNRAALTGEHAAHLARVLRARVGEEFEIATADGVRLGRVSAVTPERVEFELAETVSAGAAGAVTILVAIFKFDRYEWAIEKLTELGGARIIPVIARRTDAHLAKAAGKRAERWRRIALAAAEQSRREAPPEIADPAPLEKLLARDGMRVVLVEPNTETGQTPSLQEVLQSQRRARELPLTLAIGPEGGWTAGELDSFRQAGWQSASLGALVLRAETAAIAALAVANVAF